jgi:hypothetical protein
MVALYGFLAEERRKDAWMLERRLKTDLMFKM